MRGTLFLIDFHLLTLETETVVLAIYGISAPFQILLDFLQQTFYHFHNVTLSLSLVHLFLVVIHVLQHKNNAFVRKIAFGKGKNGSMGLFLDLRQRV